MEREDKRGIFFGIIGVLTLIVAIIGASFAYFSINAKSEENALIVNAASVQIVYDDGDQIAISGLIPSERRVAETAFSRAGQSDGQGGTYEMCIDDKGYAVCGTYEFTLTNNGDSNVFVKSTVIPSALNPQSTDEETGAIIPAEKGFSNLKFVLYDITDSNNETLIYEGTFGYNNFGLFGETGEETQELPGKGTTNKYRLFVWLDEAKDMGGNPIAQDEEQGAVFRGTVKIDVVGAENGTISGTINN